MDLKEENKILKKRLSLARDFINREIKSHMKNISTQKIEHLEKEKRENFFDENIEEIITKSIYDYFWDDLIFVLDKSIIDNIVSAEVFYHNLIKNNFLDGVSVINSYQKAIDFLIEKNITLLFRKFAKTKHIPLIKNDLTEKNLHSIVEKWYKLGFTRLFSLIKAIKEEKKLYDYGNTFYNFLGKYGYISEIILSDDFYRISRFLADWELFWAKRHNSKITLEEVKKSRSLIIWDFRDKNSLIYKLALLWEI